MSARPEPEAGLLQHILPKRAPLGDADETEAAIFPVAVAGIDVGSNAMRFIAARFASATAYEVIEQVRTPVRLGHDVFLSGRLAPSAMDAAIEALAGYRARMDALGIVHYRAVATSAVRDSDNGGAFRARARAEAAIELEVITGAEEARVVHQAIRHRIPLRGSRWVTADLGGGSVEVSLVDDDGVHWSVSHGMGSVRLLEELTVAGDEPGRFRRRLEEYAATLRIPPALRRGAAGFIATGGNIEALAKLAAAPKDERGVSTLELDALRGTIDALARLSYRQRVTELRLREDRADVILPAAMVYERIAVLAGFDAILVPHVGVKEGVVIDLVDDLASHGLHGVRHDRAVFAGCLALGRRFRFDEPHARHVTRLALALFDSLADLHELGPADRRVMLAAAMLHDVGVFIDHRRHHRHSHYIISQSELPGFTPDEIQLVANVARYHRKAGPTPAHEAYARLSEPDRLRVRALASLLRVADALDREHLQKVRNLVARIDDDAVVLTVGAHGDLLLEQWALQRKSDLFRDTFRRPIRIDGRNGPA
jgi:exopolyphosphatase / guanosine-5'-triphosphate,3'-diphosphate pyrophosphatase